MKKRRHHYVWREYLRPWSENEKIWCKMDGEYFNANLMNIAQKKDFYKLKELSTQDIIAIKKMLIDPLPKHLQDLNKGWLDIFNMVFSMKRFTSDLGINSTPLENFYDEAIHNLEEDMHSKIECDAIQLLRQILNEDISFYQDDEQALNFIFYLCVQYMRTNKMRDGMVKAFNNSNILNMDKVWSITAHILATNMGWSLYSDRQNFSLVLLKSDSAYEFITGDQPVINTHATMNKTPPDKLELFYPVSPRLAILLTDDDMYKNTKTINISSRKVREYNHKIIHQSHSQIYTTKCDYI